MKSSIAPVIRVNRIGLIRDFDFNDEFINNFNSIHTQKAYKADLKSFFSYICNKFGRIQNLERIHVISYRDHLKAFGGRKGKPASPKTIIRKLAAIKTYCDFLIERGIISSNPTENVKRPRDQILSPTNCLSDIEVVKLLNSVNLESLTGKMHHALLSVLLSTGMRKSEVINLKFIDFQKIDGHFVLKYKAKGEKYSLTPLHPYTAKSLLNYLEEMEGKNRKHNPDDFLFQPTRNPSEKTLNKKLQPMSVDYIVKKYCKTILINKKISPHSTRATVISSLLEGGEDIYKVAKLVNHSSVKTTQAYDKRDQKISDSPVFSLKYL